MTPGLRQQIFLIHPSRESLDDTNVMMGHIIRWSDTNPNFMHYIRDIPPRKIASNILASNLMSPLKWVIRWSESQVICDNFQQTDVSQSPDAKLPPGAFGPISLIFFYFGIKESCPIPPSLPPQKKTPLEESPVQIPHAAASGKHQLPWHHQEAPPRSTTSTNRSPGKTSTSINKHGKPPKLGRFYNKSKFPELS